MNTYVLDPLDLENFKTAAKGRSLFYKKIALPLPKGNATIIRRIKHLEQEGYIMGVELMLDHSKLGKKLNAFYQPAKNRCCLSFSPTILNFPMWESRTTLPTKFDLELTAYH